MLKRRLPERLMPLVSSFGLKPFYGDIHNHCALSYGHGSLEDALKRAKRQLDFVSITGHAHWPDMPVDDPTVAHIVDFHVKGFAKLAKAWPRHFRTLDAFNEPGRFTVFPGYEIHSLAYGDYTIVYKDLEPRQTVLADSPSKLKAALQARYPGASMAFPHHIGYRLGARGIDWAVLDPQLSPVIEMISMHGCSETSLTDRPFLHSMGPSDGHSTIRHGLALGHVFGMLGNTDHHSGYPGSYGHGRSCLYARENSADALWEALWSRRTNALTGDCTHLFIASGDTPQGSVMAPASTADLRIEAVGGGAIDYIDIIRNGGVVHRITPEITPAPIDVSDEGTQTILVLELGWGERGSSHRWIGEVDLEDGEIVAVEPRLRGSEIVSPLEGEADAADTDSIACDGNTIRFDVRAHANPNNLTPQTQAIAARVRLGPHASIRARFGDLKVEIPAARLFEGALSGNIGPIDSPAYRFHPLPLECQWQWQGSVPLDGMEAGEYVYARMRQLNGHWTWTSPLFCRT